MRDTRANAGYAWDLECKMHEYLGAFRRLHFLANVKWEIPTIDKARGEASDRAFVFEFPCGREC